MEKLVFSELKYPSMRDELISYLEGLSDPSYQYKAWVERTSPELSYDELNYTVHFLYDDTQLANDPDAWIGLVLKNKDEAQALKGVGNAIENVFEIYGLDLSDSEYLGKKEWACVVEASRHALRVIRG